MPSQCCFADGSPTQSCPTTQETIRRFLCACCRVAVYLCTACDRGQRYCSIVCARSARCQAQRGSDRRYQSTQRGRLKHVERSRRYRLRRRSVTEHSSVLSPEHDVCRTGTTSEVPVPASLEETATIPTSGATTADQRGSSHQVKCHFCRRWCDLWVRHVPLRRRISGRRSKSGARSRPIHVA